MTQRNETRRHHRHEAVRDEQAERVLLGPYRQVQVRGRESAAAGQGLHLQALRDSRKIRPLAGRVRQQQ